MLMRNACLRASGIRAACLWLACAVGVMGALLLAIDRAPAVERPGWHLKGWQYRMPVQVYNSSTTDKTGVLLALDDFPFLTLLNDGKLAADARDLRLVNSAGQTVPTRADWLLNDEGRSRLVFFARSAPAGEFGYYWLYYGNPAATAGPALERDEQVLLHDGLGASFGAEESLAAAPAVDPAAKTRWLADYRLYEAKSGTVAGAASLVEPRKSRTDDISGSSYVAFAKNGKGSWTVTADAEAGDAVYWVRYCPSTVNVATMGTLIVTVAQAEKTLATTTVDLRKAAADDAPDPDADGGLDDDMKAMLEDEARQEVERTSYRWLPLRAVFAKGAVTVTVAGDRTQAGVDCLLVTKRLAYQPDARDFKGRVWVRWRLTAAAGKIYTNINNQIRYGMHGAVWQPTGDVGYFGLRPPQQKPGQGAEADFIAAGEFSPWVLLPTSSYNTWYTLFTFQTPAGMTLVKNAPVELQFANRPSPSHVFHVTKGEQIENHTVKVRMPTETTIAGLAVLETYGDWLRRREKIVADLKLSPPPRLQKLRIGTSFTNTTSSDTSYEILDREMTLMESLGFNDFESFQTDEIFARLAKAHGIIDTKCYARVYPPFINAPSSGKIDADLEEWFDRVLERPFIKYCADLKKNRPFIASMVTHFDIGDEIGPMIDARGILASPPLLPDFRAFLQKKGLTPQDFGMAKWEDVNPLDDRAWLGHAKQLRRGDPGDAPEDPDAAIDPTVAFAETTYPPEKSLEAAKLFYYTRRYIDSYNARFYRHGTDVLAKEFPNHRIISPNYQAGPMQIAFLGNNNDTGNGLLDIFQLSREHVFYGLQVEDWVGGNDHGIGRELFAGEIMRSAARKNGDNMCALQVGGEAIKHEMYAFLMHGVTKIRSYLYGPLQNIGPAWGEYPQSNAAAAELTREIKPFEDAIVEGALRPRRAAMLVAYTADVMQVNGGVAHCPLRQNTFMALAHGYVPIDVVCEQEILEDDILKKYALLYVTDPQMPVAVHRKIADWVKAGGRLWASAGGGNWDEFNRRCTVLDEVFGVKGRELTPVKTDGGKTPPPATTISADSPLFGGALTLPVWDYALACTPTTATVLGAYPDGTPAVLLNRYGAGEAMLVGAQVGTSYLNTHFASNITDPAWSYARGSEATRLLSALVARAGVERPVVLDLPGIYTAVWDTPRGTLVFLNNSTYAALRNVQERRPAPQVTARIRVPGPVKSVRSKGGELKFTQAGNEVTVSLTLPDTDILLLK